ncbi:MAG: transposase [Deltaproteobacteria bacterium]|nr:transposase [Deltaproteobacteria bacterium]
MPRPKRILIPNAYYYISNESKGKRSAFSSATDKKYFTDLLHEIAKEFKLKVLEYSLTRQGYHLLIQMHGKNLPLALRSLNGIYTQDYNRKYQKKGSLFKGRYKSVLMSERPYVTQIANYIRSFAKKSLLSKVSEDVLQRLNPKKWPSVLGSEKFLKKMKKKTR